VFTTMPGIRRCVATVSAVVLLTSAVVCQTTTTIENSYAQLSVQYTAGTKSVNGADAWLGSITDLGALGGSFSFLRDSLWTIEVWDKTNNPPQTVRFTPRSPNVNYTLSVVRGNSWIDSGGATHYRTILLTWDQIVHPNLPNVALRVQMYFVIPKNSGWARPDTLPPDLDMINISSVAQVVQETLPAHCSIYSFTAPKLRLFSSTGSPSDYSKTVAYPAAGGWILRDPGYAQNFVIPEKSDDIATIADEVGNTMNVEAVPTHPGTMSMQWFAAYDDVGSSTQPMLYYSDFDISYSRKEFRLEWMKNNHDFRFSHRYVNPDNLNDATNTAIIPCYCGIALMHGNWYDAAKRYRSWATGPWGPGGKPAPWIPEDASGALLPMYADTSYSQYSSSVVPAIASAADGPASCPSISVVPDNSQWSNWFTGFQQRVNHYGLAGTPIPTDAVEWDYDSSNLYGQSGATIFTGGNIIRGFWFDSLLSGPVGHILSQFSGPLTQVTDQLGAAVAPHMIASTYDELPPGVSTMSFPNSYVPGAWYGASVLAQARRGDDGTVVYDAGSPPSNFISTKDKRFGCTVSVNSVAPFALDVADPFVSAYVDFLGLSTRVNNYATASGRPAGALGLYVDVVSVLDGPLCWHDEFTTGTPAHGHAGGGGNYSTLGLKSLLQTVRSNGRGVANIGPRYYLISESNTESLLYDAVSKKNELDLTYGQWPYQDFFDPVNNAAVYFAPLFDSVYHDFHRSAEYQRLFVENSTLNFWLQTWISAFSRAFYADSQHWGRMPWIGETFNGTYADQLRLSTFTAFQEVDALVSDIINLNKNPTARSYLVFGERMRDPNTPTTQNPIDTTYSGAGAGLFEIANEVRYVRISAFRRTDLKIFPKTSSVGLYVLNWKLSSEWTPVTLGITIDPISLGLANGTYSVTEVSPNGTMTSLAPLTIAGAPVTYNYLPPSDTARLLVIK